MNKRFYPVPVLWILCLVVLLGGCGRELQQQQAFESFLQKEVIPRNSGILIPTMAMRKKFGVYASHFDVIVEYNKAVLERVGKPLEKLQRDYQDAVKPEANVEERRKAIIKYRESLRSIEAALDKELAWTESEIAKLDQPDELRKVYNLAVEKHIRIPAKVLKAMIPATEEMMNKNLDLLDFIAANKGKVEIKDGQIQVDGKKDKDQATLNRLREMQDEIIRMAKAIQTQHNEFTRQLISK
jgi:predicted RND superfamily exporter protein